MSKVQPTASVFSLIREHRDSHGDVFRSNKVQTRQEIASDILKKSQQLHDYFEQLCDYYRQNKDRPCQVISAAFEDAFQQSNLGVLFCERGVETSELEIRRLTTKRVRGIIAYAEKLTSSKTQRQWLSQTKLIALRNSCHATVRGVANQGMIRYLFPDSDPSAHLVCTDAYELEVFDSREAMLQRLEHLHLKSKKTVRRKKACAIL